MSETAFFFHRAAFCTSSVFPQFIIHVFLHHVILVGPFSPLSCSDLEVFFCRQNISISAAFLRLSLLWLCSFPRRFPVPFFTMSAFKWLWCSTCLVFFESPPPPSQTQHDVWQNPVFRMEIISAFTGTSPPESCCRVDALLFLLFFLIQKKLSLPCKNET